MISVQQTVKSVKERKKMRLSWKKNALIRSVDGLCQLYQYILETREIVNKTENYSVFIPE